MWQTTCGVAIRSVMKENGGGGSSPGCTSSPAQSIVRAVEPRRRAGLEPAERKAVAGAGSATGRATAPRRPGPAGIFSSPIWMRPLRKVPVVSTTRPAAMSPAVAEHEPADPPAGVEQQILGRPLDDVEIRRLGQQFGDRAAVELAVGLGARPAHRRPLAAVQHAELDAGPVDRPAHDAVERIDLAHQMPLAEPADRRVARHLADRRPLMRQQHRARPEPRRRRRRLAPGMPAADHDDVVARNSRLHDASEFKNAAAGCRVLPGRTAYSGIERPSRRWRPQTEPRSRRRYSPRATAAFR